MSERAIPERRLNRQFPRSKALPIQSSKFWAKEKDRYIRQLMISDIEEQSGREVIVYFSQLDEGISHSDADDISEIIEALSTKHADLILQTPGGMVDAVEKFVIVLKARLHSFRVIVPSWAKSGGTVIAMSSDEILLGVNSELGPIDPQMFVPDIGPVPCDLISKDEDQPNIIREIASNAVDRMRILARKILKEGMLSKADDEALDSVIQKLSSSNTYKSHGAVIDFSEAKDLGLKVQWLEPESDFWKRIWLLYCCYDYDSKRNEIGKMSEGAVNSLARRASH